MLLVVVNEVRPKLLVNANVPLPPTAFLTIWTDPRDGIGLSVLLTVHVVVSPATTVMAAGVPFVQVALDWDHPTGTVSVKL